MKLALLALVACGGSSTPVTPDRDWRCFVVDPAVSYTSGRGHATHIAQRLYADRLVIRGVYVNVDGTGQGELVYRKAGDHFEAPESHWPPTEATLQAPDGTRWTETIRPWKDRSKHTDVVTVIDADGMTMTQRNEQGVIDYDDHYVVAPCAVIDAELAKYRRGR